MLHRAASNAYSWWWASHIRTKQSKWLDNNLQEMEEKVQYTLKLIDEDGDSFARRAESYYRKRPELIGFVEEFYRAYRAMAERYDHISGELQNANHTIATVFPEQVQFAMDEEDETGSPKMPPPRQIDPSKVPKDLPEVPKIAIPDFLKHLKKDKSSRGGPPKRMQSKKNHAPVIPVSGLSKAEAIEEIDKLQKGILALQTEKEFVKSSYENRLSKYWEIEKAITEMQEKVCGLQDEFNVGTLIDDNEARSLMASTALKSCQETLIQLQEKQERSNKEAKMEYERVKSAHEKLVALKGEFLPNETHQTEFISGSSSLKLSEEESRDLQKEILDAESIREKIREHFEMNSGSSLTVPELAEKIDELVTKVISLETAVSTQTALINRLRSETDDLQENLRNLEEDKATLLQDSNKLSEKLKEVEGDLNLVHDLNRSVENQNNNLQTHFTEAHCNLDHLSEKLKSVKPLEEEVENMDPQLEEAGSFFGKKKDKKHEEKENVTLVKPLDEEIKVTGSSQAEPNSKPQKEHEKESNDVMVQTDNTMNGKEKEKEAGTGTEEGQNLSSGLVDVAKELPDVMAHEEHQEPKDVSNKKVTGAEEVPGLGLELEVEHDKVPAESVNQKEKAAEGAEAKEFLNLGLELAEHEKVLEVSAEEQETGADEIQGQGLELAEHEKVPVISVNAKETGAGAEKVQGQGLELAEHERVPAISVNEKETGAGAEKVQGQGLELAEHERVPAISVNEEETGAGAEKVQGQGLELAEHEKVPAIFVNEKETGAGAEKVQDQGLELAEHEQVPEVYVDEKETGVGAEKVQGQGLEIEEHEKVLAVNVNEKETGAGAEKVHGQGLELAEHEKVQSQHVNGKEKATGAGADEGLNLGLEPAEHKKVPAEPVNEKEKAAEAGAEKAWDRGLEPAEPNSSRSIPDDIFGLTLYPTLLGDDGKLESTKKDDFQENTDTEEEFPDQEEPNWQQLFLSGLDDRERMLLGEYTTILRKYKETRRQLSELQMKNNDAQFEAMVQLRELKSAIAMKDEEIQSLRQKLKIMQESEKLNDPKSHQPEIDSLQEKPHDMLKEDKEEVTLIPEHPQASDSQDRNVEAEAEAEAEPKPKPDNVRTEADEVVMVIPKEDRVISTLEEKFRRDIDELLEENLEFWLRFSGLFQEIQKFQTSIDDLQSDYKKLRGQKNQEESTSSRHGNSLKSDARPIYQHLREIQTELAVWIEKNMLLKDELQFRLSSLRNIQEEISRVSNTSSGTDVEFTSYQAAKFQGEVLNMQQENNKVADELQAGLEHVKGLQTEVEKSVLQMDEEFKLSGSRNHHHHVIHSLSRTRIPLRSFLFGVKSKKQKPSLFACINPTLQKNYSDLHQGHAPT